MKEFTKGFNYLLLGMKFLLRPKIRLFVIIPTSVNLVLFAYVLYLLTQLGGNFIDWAVASLPSWLDWLQWLLWPLIVLTLLLVTFQTFAIVGNLLIAPFNALLSEQVERIQTGESLAQNNQFEWRAFLQQIPRALLRELSKLLYILPRLLPALLLFIIPVVNMIAPAIWLVVNSWMMSVEYVDYPIDNRQQAFKQVIIHLREKRLLAFGFGAGVALLLMIPIVNFIVMPAAVCGGTLLWLEHFKPKSSL